MLGVRLLEGSADFLDLEGRTSWSASLPRTLSEENRRISEAIAESLRFTSGRISRISSIGVQLVLPGSSPADGDALGRQRSGTPEFLCRICYCNDDVATNACNDGLSTDDYSDAPSYL